MNKLARLLYHYAAEPYDELRTRRAQGTLTRTFRSIHATDLYTWLVRRAA